jgi:hypothetical protein
MRKYCGNNRNTKSLRKEHMRVPLWKISSGDFAGWKDDDILYDSNGNNVGYFRGDVAYSLSGDYVGELHGTDRIGVRAGVSHSLGSPRAGHVGIASAQHANRIGQSIAGWDDPDF